MVSVACNLTGALIVYFFLYESSDLSLESVDDVRMFCYIGFTSFWCDTVQRCTMTRNVNRGRQRSGLPLDTLPDTTSSNRPKLLKHGNLSPVVQSRRNKSSMPVSMVTGIPPRDMELLPDKEVISAQGRLVIRTEMLIQDLDQMVVLYQCDPTFLPASIFLGMFPPTILSSILSARGRCSSSQSYSCILPSLITI